MAERGREFYFTRERRRELRGDPLRRERKEKNHTVAPSATFRCPEVRGAPQLLSRAFHETETETANTPVGDEDGSF